MILHGIGLAKTNENAADRGDRLRRRRSRSLVDERGGSSRACA